jgi:hypothetical protein
LYSISPAERFKASLFNDKCFEIFGLIRRTALAKTPLIGSYAYGDGVLLARLAILGQFKEIPEYLFCLRRHPEQSTHMWEDYTRYTVWFNPKLKKKWVFPYCRMQYELLCSIKMRHMSLGEVARCYKYWVQKTYNRRSFIREELASYIRKKLPLANLLYRRLKKLFAGKSI